MSNKKRKAQNKLINELKSQLFVQAERLGVRDQYTPTAMEEMKMEALRKILNEFYMERSNLEYELNMLGSKKKDLLIKLERLSAYIQKTEMVREKHAKNLGEMLDKETDDKKKVRRLVRRMRPTKVLAAA